MASADTVIYNFAALEEAIRKFREVSGQIGSLGSSVQANASTLQGAWKSNASTAYAEKMSGLVSNFTKASERLEADVTELQRLCNEGKEAERAAKGIAEAISDFGMQ